MRGSLRSNRTAIGQAVRVFANGPGDLGSIPDRVIPKTQKMVLDASLLNTQHYKVRIKGKVEQSREGVAPSPTPWCSSYRKGSLRVTLDYGHQLYLLTIGHNRVSFTFSWAAQLGASLSGCWFSLPYLISNCNCSIGGLRAHSAGCWLSLPHLVPNSSDLQLIEFPAY